MRFHKRLAFILLILSINNSPSIGQKDYPSLDFVNIDSNSIKNSEALFPLFQQLHNGKPIRIIHIGDSHIQADYFSGRIRTNLQLYFDSIFFNRGFVFPYTIAQTNAPDDYYFSLSGNWSFTKASSVISANTGLSGIEINSMDSLIKGRILLNPDSRCSYTFDQLKIFMNQIPDDLSFRIPPDSTQVLHSYSIAENSVNIQLNQLTRLLNFEIFNPNKDSIGLNGIALFNSKSKINYYNIGLNGAKASTYLNNPLFFEAIHELKPNLIILSLGTNDLFKNGKTFNQIFKDYQILLDSLKQFNCSILLMTPPDHLEKRKFKNKNIDPYVELINNLAHNNVAVWDLYQVMGGNGSIKIWYENDLAWKDFIHYTKKGYYLQADIFFSSFIHEFEKFIDGSD